MASSLRRSSVSPIFVPAKPKSRLPIYFEEGGPTYWIKPPKTSILVAIASRSSTRGEEDAGSVANDFDNILKLMFEPKDLEKIHDRLASVDDDLDYDQIFDAIDAVTEGQTGNPTS
jgi:hypothetical protein